MTDLISEQGRVLFKEALIDFRLHPEKHKQAEWICNTGCCLGGSIALAVGAIPVERDANGKTAYVAVVDALGRRVVNSAAQVATNALGVSDADAQILYAAHNTIDQLEVMFSLLDSGVPLHGRCSCGANCVASGELRQALLDAGLPPHEYEDYC